VVSIKGMSGMYTINVPAYKLTFSAKVCDAGEARLVAKAMALRFGWASFDGPDMYEAYSLDNSGSGVALCDN
jgi:hypothetical protein